MTYCKLVCAYVSLATVGLSQGCCSFRDVTTEYPEWLGDARLIDGHPFILMRIVKPTRCYGYFEYELDGPGTASDRENVTELDGRAVKVVQVFEQDFLVGDPRLMLAVEAPTGGSEGLPPIVRALILPGYVDRDDE